MMSPKQQVEQFLEYTEDARRLSQRCRDYYDSKQWSAREAAILENRKQAPIVVNRIRPKVEGLIGLLDLRKTDPKAFPRTQKHEKASQVVTDALRFVADNNKFGMTRLDVGEDFFVEGYGGALIDVRRKGDEIEIQINQIPWDRIYFDPHSRRKDFKDAKFMGMWMWMSRDEAKDTFKISKAKMDQLSSETDSEETNEDRPRWKNNMGDRVRIAMHYHLDKGTWKLTVFSGDVEIKKTQDSPFLDEDKLPMNPMELVSANISRDNNRYGEVAGFLSQQDEINHRRSKFLHWNSTRQTYGNETSVKDIPSLKRELSKPDGHIELQAGAEFGKDFGIMQNQDLSSAQFNLYLDAKQELDAVSANAQMAGDRQGDLSGKAIGKLQQAGTIELNRQYSQLASWENRVHTQVWARIKQFWNDEKFIRVTDDQDALRWVGLNSKVTAETLLMESSEDASLPPDVRQQYAQTLQILRQTQNPRLNEIVETRNPTSELDVDIIIEQSFDVINAEQEQFEMMAQFANGTDIDILDLIELSQIRGKDELIKKIERKRGERAQAQSQSAQAEQQLVQAERAAKIKQGEAKAENISADTLTKHIKAITGQLENANLQRNPDSEVQVSV